MVHHSGSNQHSPYVHHLNPAEWTSIPPGAVKVGPDLDNNQYYELPYRFVSNTPAHAWVEVEGKVAAFLCTFVDLMHYLSRSNHLIGGIKPSISIKRHPIARESCWRVGISCIWTNTELIQCSKLLAKILPM